MGACAGCLIRPRLLRMDAGYGAQRTSLPSFPGVAPLNTSRLHVGIVAATAILALRLGIGLHFFLEGAAKLEDPKSFSSGFLANAKGPLAKFYTSMVWDADGLHRLDREGTLAFWDNYKNRVVSHFGFDAQQTKAADRVLLTYDSRLRAFLGSRSDEIEEYYQQLERRDKNAKDPARKLASLQAHEAKITGERMKLRGQLLPTIDGLWKDLENDLNALSTDEQYKRHGRLAIGKIGTRFGDSAFVDKMIPWFNIIVGSCLMLGLFTRPAAIAGGLFLLSVCMSQWPGSQGAAPIYYQAVEMLAMFALAGIGAGQFLGIDYLLGKLFRRQRVAEEVVVVKKR